MDGGTVNSFLDQFLALADAGFGLIQGDVSFVLNALIVISITLAGAQWALGGEAPMAPFFRKVLFIGLFAFLVNNWDAVATAVNQSGAMLGLRAGGSGLSLADLHNPARVAALGKELYGQMMALGEGLNIFTDFFTMITLLVAAFVVMIAFFVLALQVSSRMVVMWRRCKSLSRTRPINGTMCALIRPLSIKMFFGLRSWPNRAPAPRDRKAPRSSQRWHSASTVSISSGSVVGRGSGSWPINALARAARASALAPSKVIGPNRPSVIQRCWALRPRPIRTLTMKIFAPCGVTRTPKPGKAASQTV